MPEQLSGAMDGKVLQLQPYKLFSPLLHDVEHVSDTVTLLQTLLVTFELIPEILDDESFQTLCFFVASCVSGDSLRAKRLYC